MSEINIELLKKTEKELREIKNGKGITKETDKIPAGIALKHLSELIEKLERV